jgi:hypothetical protein
MPKYLTNYGFHELFLYITRTHVVFRVNDALVAANDVIKIKVEKDAKKGKLWADWSLYKQTIVTECHSGWVCGKQNGGGGSWVIHINILVGV